MVIMEWPYCFIIWTFMTHIPLHFKMLRLEVTQEAFLWRTFRAVSFIVLCIRFFRHKLPLHRLDWNGLQVKWRRLMGLIRTMGQRFTTLVGHWVALQGFRKRSFPTLPGHVMAIHGFLQCEWAGASFWFTHSFLFHDCKVELKSFFLPVLSPVRFWWCLNLQVLEPALFSNYSLN